jgi:thioredoxin-like negative regulator of GroEL
VTVESLQGHPVLITFWASWCAPCRVELPELKKLHDELSSRGLVLITVNIDDYEPAAHRFLEVTELELPVYRMSRRDLAVLGVRSIPTTLLLGPDGTPVQLFEGYTPTLVDVLRKLIGQMLTGADGGGPAGE